jgi:catechol 2,3-dioxygenase-like lactoylglutathione lyase family enzyme
MLGPCKIATFVATSDTERAKEFYGEKLGLTLIEDDPYALVYAVGDTTLRIQKGQNFTPQQFTVLGWHVPDIESAVKQLKEKGVHFERYDGFGQDDLDIMTFPNGAKVAWFKDPDGNVLSLDNQ